MANQQNEHRGGSGNFANDPKRAADAGRKGGEHSHQHEQAASEKGSSHQQGSHEKNNDTKTGQR